MKLDPSLGPVILADLRKKFPEIPYTGVLAGGAVADWFFGLEPNDIDVFVQATTSHFDSAYHGLETSRVGIPQPEFDPYEGCRVISWKHLYKVVSSRRNGKLNTIACDATDLTASKVISGFDLNACRVAIDLDSQRLVWDESFAQFLKNRQLRVTALFTPAHTAIRFFLKRDRLKCFGDEKVEMEIISEAWNSERIDTGDYSLPTHFGAGYLEKALEASPLGLSKYFTIEELDKFWTIHPKNIDAAFNVEHLEHIMFPVHAPQALRSQRTPINDQYAEKIELVKSTATSPVVLKMVELFSGGYVRGKVTPRSIKSVSSFLNRRPALEPHFMGLYLERQLQVMRRFFRYARRHGSWIYGMVQNEATQLDVISDDSFSSLVARFEPIYSKKIIPEVKNSSRNFLWFSITENRSLKELFSAAESLKLSVDSITASSMFGARSVSIQSKLSKANRSLAVIRIYQPFGSLIHSNSTALGHKLTLGCQIAAIWYLSSIEANDSKGHLAHFIDNCKKVASNLLQAKLKPPRFVPKKLNFAAPHSR